MSKEQLISEGKGIRCPECGSPATKVIDSRQDAEVVFPPALR